MEKVQITTPGIKKALSKYNYKQSVAEYFWNGFDAQASAIELAVEANDIGTISKLIIADNGYGIQYDLLKSKFVPFFESDKEIDPNVERKTSAIHGKNGVGRLTFFQFAQEAKWSTVFERNGRNYVYEIVVNTESLDSYVASDPQETDQPTGTTVYFNGIFGVTAYEFQTEIYQHLQREFGWFLELNEPRGFSIGYLGKTLDYSGIVGERACLPFQANGVEFDIRYVRWNVSLNKEYSRYYFIGSDNREVENDTTTLNNKGDHFYHSVFITSKYFDLFSSNGFEGQASLLGSTRNDETFQDLMSAVNQFLRTKRKPFLVEYSGEIIADFEKDGAFPSFTDNQWDTYRKQELENVIRELVQIEPKIFSRLNIEQKKTFAYLLNLIIDAGEKERLFNILDQIVNLDPAEREDLSRLLKTSRLSSVIKTIQLIEDRYRTVNQLRELVFNKELGANERDHVQKAIEKHYWIFGEQYHLVTAEEPKFEEALRRYVWILRGEDEKTSIDHPDKRKEMDIFMVRQNMRQDTIHHIVVELKHPQVKLGETQVSQVKRYLRVIFDQDEFNGPNRFWEFYLVGNRFDATGFIESEIRNSRHHGERSLIFRDDRYKIYTKTWDELFAEFEIRHNFLNEKLQLERSNLITEGETADEVLTAMTSNSAIQAPQITIP